MAIAIVDRARMPAHVGLKGFRPSGVACLNRAAVRVRAARSSQTIECKKVAVCGAAGGIGQPLSLLLKMNKFITQLSLYDIANVEGVAADLSHCNTPVKVAGYQGPDNLEKALGGADIVIIPAGVPRKPGMTRDDLFNINAGIVKALVEAASKYCPKAQLHIITNPVNSTVPIAAEVMKAAGVYDKRKVIGVTTLDVVRANTFVSESKATDLRRTDVPVIGGHAGITILPLLSQVHPPCSFTQDEVAKLTDKIQNAGTEVVNAKAGAGSATLSMAYAAARMAESALMGLDNQANVFECAFVESDLVPDLQYFASKVRLGPNGAEEILPLPELSEWEQQALDALKPELKGSIEKGIAFAKQ